MKEQIVSSEQIAILPVELETLVMYSKAGEIPGNVKEALGKAITMRRDVATTQGRLDERKGKVKELTEQQKHTSEILRTLQPNTQVHTRLLGKLNDLQTEIEKAQGEVDELTRKLQQQKDELDSYLANLNVG